MGAPRLPIASRPVGFLLPFILVLIALPGCLGFPFARTGPSEVWIEGAVPDERFLVKGRVPYLILPPVSRASRVKLVYGVDVTAESRDSLYTVRVHNDSAIEVWIRAFTEEGISVPSLLCIGGQPAPFKIPHALPPGAKRMIMLPDNGSDRRLRMHFTTFLDRDDIWINFRPGAKASVGYVIIPFSRYDYEKLPVACREGVQNLGGGG